MANNVGERNSMLPTSAGTTMELSTGTESEGDREETSLFTLMAGVPTLKQVIDSSDIDNVRETSARILQWCHQVSQGRDCIEELEKCLAYIISEPSMEFVRAQAWDMLGETYLLQRQIKQGQQAREKFLKVMLSLPDDPSWLENVDRYYLLSKAYLDNGKPHKSRKISEKALRYLEGKEEPFAYSQMTELLGCASEMSGDVVRAVEHYQEALSMNACGPDGMGQVTLYYRLGRVQKFLGHYIEAISTLKQGLIYAEQSGNVHLQLNFLAVLISIYNKLVFPNNFTLSQMQAKEALQRYLEAGRNRIQSYPALRSPQWDHLSEKIWDLKHAEEELKSAVEKGDLADALEETEGLAQTATNSSSSDPISIMNANRFYTNEILTGLVAKSQRLVIEIQKKLKDDEHGTDIKDEEEELDRLYRILYNLLIEPVEKYLERIPSNYNLVIIPHEDMGLIPFATLTNGKQALIERFAITVAPSICTVRLCGKLYENKVCGDGGELLVGRETGYPEGWLSLDNAHAEVKAVQEFCHSAVSITESSHDGSNDNMKTIVKQYMQKASWLHFAAHGQVSTEFPQGSLLLGCDDSSRLTGDEIGRAGPLPARAAVLSACQTALGSVRGEGILGFARAFILAGVPITILSMWEVRGSFCIEFMKNLYSALRGGLDVPHAMQKVILDMKQEQVKFRSSRINITKRKWRSSDLAAFACYGYPGVKFTAEKGKDIAPPWLDLLQDHSRYKGGKGQSGGSSSTSTS
ncbi:unnamed protein product [Sphagnum jensenii]